MRPWQHAKSSSLSTGRAWTEDLPVHEFLDETKFACADRRHRVVLHHIDLGSAVAAKAFPERDDVDALVRSHVTEDLGRAASFEEWFDQCDVPRLPTPIHRRTEDGTEGIAQLVNTRQPSALHGEVARVCDLLFLPGQFLDHSAERGWPIFMNSMGPRLARRIFGPPTSVDQGNIVVDHAAIAEAVIYTAFGRIPDLGEVVRCFTGEPTRERQR